MSSLIRWDPFGDRSTFRNSIDRLFDESFVRPGFGFIAPISAANLAIDMYETKDDVVVKAALPGIKPEQVEVTITGDTLTIRGESKEENEVKEENYVRKERRFGSFSRCVTLPSGLQAAKADATLPKTIKVKTK